MSELKAFDIVVAEEYYCEGIVKYRRAVYDKSEADKVIAEKDKQLRHQKYKRCLAMEKWCLSCRFAWSFIPEDDEVHKSNFFKKWELRWLELAEKFKEVSK